MNSFCWLRPIACLVVLCISPAAATAALEPDEIALVVNRNVPGGAKLAAIYAEARHIPEGRIIALDLPDGEEMRADVYEKQVVPVVRAFLREHALQKKVRCLVTFWGVPLRISRQTSTPAENEELADLDRSSRAALVQSAAAVAEAEGVARDLNAGFKPGAGDELPALLQRTEAAVRSVLASLPGADPSTRGSAAKKLLDALRPLYGEMELTQRLTLPNYALLAPGPLSPEASAAHQAKVKQVVKELNAALSRSATPAGRKAARDIAGDNLGAFGLLQVIEQDKTRLRTDETEAAFDSELALVLWPDDYPRYRWVVNPLNLKARPLRLPGAGKAAPAPRFPPTMMVMRLDAPTEELVKELIAVSLKTEREGLKGIVALDARGKPAGDAYGQYDQTIRDLAELLKTKTTLTVTLDDREEVFPPHSVRDVALYCGWYSLRKYVPGMTFNAGAVAFHIASSELVSLHHPDEQGWVRGLIRDGAVASLGPVAEPYLHSFPPADEFFPLLLTGKLTLAEVYWKTNPLASWMNACIGDPLYTPYKENPSLKVEDLPPRLREAVRDESGDGLPQASH